jgi:hypothetical protein
MAQEAMHPFHIPGRRADHAVQRDHATRGFLGLLGNRAHHGADLVGRFAGAMGQLAHFAGHHGKAAPVFAGARRFDGRVQGQQVGARGNLGNDFGNAGDRLRFLLQFDHGRFGQFSLGLGIADALQALVDLGAPGHTFAAHLGRHASRALGVDSDLFGAAGNLLGAAHYVDGDLHVVMNFLFYRVDKVRRFGRADHDVVDRTPDQADKARLLVAAFAP